VLIPFFRNRLIFHFFCERVSVLKGNHYHLLVDTPEGNLVVSMKWLQGTYTQRHNRRHQFFGHLFQGR